MSVSIAATPDLSGTTFYRNKDFDISFSVVNTAGIDTSLYLSNSTPTLLPYLSNGRFTSSSGVNALGFIGTVSVDVLSSNPRVVTGATAQSYVSAGGICTDPAGNVYFAVANQNKIFKLDLSGAVTTFAGDGTAGDTEGPRLTARFRAPAGLITDGSGTFYVTDQWRVRKIDSNGTVSTLAGSSTRGYLDAIGSSALFFTPGAMALRPTGGLLVTDSDYHTVRNVTLPGGAVTTYAGRPEFAAFADGSLNTFNTAGGQFVRGANANGVTTNFYETQDLSGAWTSTTTLNLYVRTMVNSLNSNSNVILYGGQYSATYGSPLVYQSNLQSPILAATGFGTTFNSIRAIAYEASLSKYLAGGSGTNHAPYVSTDGGASWTDYSSGDNVLGSIEAIAYGGSTWMAGGGGSNNSASNLLISTSSAGTAWTRTAAPNLLFVNTVAYGGGTWAVGGVPNFGQKHLATSSNSGSSWIARDISIGSPLRTVAKLAYGAGVWVAAFDLGGVLGGGPGLVYSSDLSSWSSATGSFTSNDYYAAAGLFYSTTQRKFIAALGSNIVSSADGATWSVASNVVPEGMTSFIDVSQNPGTYTDYGSSRLYFPAAVLYDPSGTLYIADQYNNRIRSVAPGSSTMTTFAGSGVDGTSNGTRTTAAMARPSSLARDSNGTIYVGSFERNTLQTILGNNVSLLAGAAFSAGYVNGPAAVARFNGLAGLASFGNTLYMSEVYNGDVRALTAFPDARPGVYRPPGFTIVATSNYPITMTSRIDPSWTSVGGSLPLFKFEPFCNTFRARVGGDTLGYSPSSTELLGYLTGTGTANVAFRGPNGANTAYGYPLVLSIQALSGTTVVDDISTSVTISPARLIVTPCNASLVFYRNEPISPVTFSIVAASASQIYAASSLPNGLTLTSNSSNSYTLRGTPVIQTLASNYTILGQDTSGRTYSTVVSMVVNPERLLLDVSGSTFFGNVVSTTPIAPVTLTARFPPYGSLRSMRYTWSEAPPAGLQFRDSNGTALSGLSYAIQAADSSFSLTLAGTITEAQVRAYAAAGKRTTTLSIVGTRTSPLPSLTPSLPTTLTFTMGQVILFGSNVPTPFVGIRTLNWWYSATSYFGTDVSISSIAITDGFLPDGITGSFTSNLQRFDLSGTIATESSYAFTLTATAGSQTADLPVSITTVPDSVFITTPVDTCFNFIQYRDLSNAKSGYYPSNLLYTARSTSGCNATITGAGLPDGLTLVDLSFGTYRLSGRPTTATSLSTGTLTAFVPASGVSSNKTFLYSVSADFFTFDPPGGSFTFAQNVPATPTQVTATTFSENPIIRYSSGDLPPTLTITNTGLITGTPQGSADGTVTVTAFTNYSSGAKPYSYTLTDDAVLLQPAVYTTTTAPGANVSIPITGYSLSALTVSNYRFSNAFPYGLSINPITGLLSGTLASTLPGTVSFNLLGSAGIVDGSLSGTMTTTNLTVNRAQMLGLDASSLTIYSSDDNGVTFTKLGSPYSNTTALTIGTNGSNVYLIPTSSNVVLKSTDGAVYTAKSFTGNSPVMTAVVNKPGTSTWWIAGSIQTGATDRAVYVYRSTDDGETWNSGTLVSPLTDRGGNIEPYTTSYQAYINGGVALAYKDGVLLIGGDRILRSTDDGVSWSSVAGGFTQEVAYFSLDHETVWIATGSDGYQSRTSTPYAGATTTIKYSVDTGLTWTNASAFNMVAYDVRHGLGQWMATGLDWVGPSQQAEVKVRYSFDGVTWTVLSAVPAVAYTSAFTKAPPLPIEIGFDETDWVLFRTPDDETITRYVHPYNTPLTSGWVSAPVASGEPVVTSTSRFTSYVAQTIDPGADITTITFPLPNTGPTFVSPAQSTYVVWQYMPLPTITFTALGTGIVYFASALPVGLVWNGATRSITGAPMRTGIQTFTVYAKNSGITAFTVTFIVEVPRIVKRQTGAGAYTSLVRQYTEVNAAQAARDTRALPNESRTLGEFAAPYPPSVITPSNCPC